MKNVTASSAATLQQHRTRRLLWATSVYWTGKAAGVLVAAEKARVADGRRTFEFDSGDVGAAGWARWARARAWTVACLAAVVHRIRLETWPVTVQAATVLPRASCYDTVCGGVWCVSNVFGVFVSFKRAFRFRRLRIHYLFICLFIYFEFQRLEGINAIVQTNTKITGKKRGQKV